MSLIMEQIKPEYPELFALEFGKIAETDFVYILASPNINQSAPNLATIYMPIRSGMSLTMGQIERENPELLALELEKLLNMTLFTLYHLQILTNQHQTWSKCM